jgi:putative transposase
MRHSKSEMYLHMVWATKHREPFLTPEVERSVHRCIQKEAARLNCVVLALNGMPDHVHLLVRIPTRLSAASLANQVKGVSSHFASDQLHLPGFRWQEGYNAISLSRSHIARACEYIKNQKRHHAAGKT